MAFPNLNNSGTQYNCNENAKDEKSSRQKVNLLKSIDINKILKREDSNRLFKKRKSENFGYIIERVGGVIYTKMN
jgi:hypothetical protein